jgi:putative transposase
VIFRDDADCQVYLVILRGVVGIYCWHVLSYCLMPNHVHLLVETTEANLGDGMRRLHGHYGRMFNWRYGHWGHLFRRPYGNTVVKNDEQLLRVIGYIAANPVAAGLCRDPNDWVRGSHLGIVGLADDDCCARAQLLWWLDGIGGDGRALYRQSVRARLDAIRDR